MMPHGRLGWLEVECNRCKTRASPPLADIRRSRDTPIWNLRRRRTVGRARRPDRAVFRRRRFPLAVEAVQRRGVRVTVVSTISSQSPMIADELRRQADVCTDLVELQSTPQPT
jgi:hypothetical protein